MAAAGAHAVEMAREGVPLIVIQRQLGHSNLGITSVYLQGIDNGEIIETVRRSRTDGPRERIAPALILQTRCAPACRALR
jgi:integrase